MQALSGMPSRRLFDSRRSGLPTSSLKTPSHRSAPQIDAIGIRSGAEDACTLVLDVREFVSDAVSNSDISGPSVAHR